MTKRKLPQTSPSLAGKQAISYLRFSSAQSGNGAMYDRQRDALERVCAQHGMTLDEGFIDGGRSVPNGKHESKLRRILAMVETGEIARGTPLVIESIDRLVRETPAESYRLLSKVIEAGVTVVTGDGAVYDEEAINSMQAMPLLVEIARAENEQRECSLRARAARARKAGV